MERRGAGSADFTQVMELTSTEVLGGWIDRRREEKRAWMPGERQARDGEDGAAFAGPLDFFSSQAHRFKCRPGARHYRPHPL